MRHQLPRGINYGLETKEGNSVSNRWISVNEEVPSVKNKSIDEMVLVMMRNKNKEDGIFLADISSFDGECWSKRHNSWEDIIAWKPIKLPSREEFKE